MNKCLRDITEQLKWLGDRERAVCWLDKGDDYVKSCFIITAREGERGRLREDAHIWCSKNHAIARFVNSSLTNWDVHVCVYQGSSRDE